ncbi:MAG: ABC transporter ATP-binding protein [Candidatus Limnocylindrales bacterium]
MACFPEASERSFGLDLTETTDERVNGAPAGVSSVASNRAAPAARDTPAIQAVEVSFRYPGRTSRQTASPADRLALDRVTLAVGPGEFVALVGANGSGKSTLLRLLAGLLHPTGGRVDIAGEPISAPDRRVGVVFQEPRLLPWRSVVDNVAFPLELAGWPADRRGARARELLELVGLVGVDDERPHRLSGGMRQRAAIARALALEPGILLLDEPFSALDSLTRERLNLALQEIWRRTGTSVVLVTHSIAEAIFLADRVLVLARRSAGIAGTIAIPLARPRSLATLDAADVSGIAAAVRDLLAADEEPVR